MYELDVIRSPSLYRSVRCSLTHLLARHLRERISQFGAVFSPAVISLSECKHSLGTGWCRQADRGDFRAKSLTSVLIVLKLLIPPILWSASGLECCYWNAVFIHFLTISQVGSIYPAELFSIHVFISHAGNCVHKIGSVCCKMSISIYSKVTVTAQSRKLFQQFFLK